MNVHRWVLAGLVILAIALPAHAQPAEESGARETLQWTAALTLPAKTTARYLAFDVPPEIYGKSKNHLADLRIFDADGQKVPFAIRELRTKIEQQNVPIQRDFNPGDGNERALELLDGGAGFNEIEIDTKGTEFRRTVKIYGAQTFDFKKEQEILPARGNEHLLVHYDTEKGVIDIRKLRFPLQRYPFVRVVVKQDAGDFDDRPKITHITVRRATSLQGKYLTPRATLTGGGGVRGDGGPGTAWFIDLGDEVPCEGLSFRVHGQEVDRPFRLEIAAPDDQKTNVLSLARSGVTGVDWRWRREGEQLFLDATFPEIPVAVKRLRLVVTDFDNPPLQLDPDGVTYKTCVRRVVFERPDKGFAEPLKLYIGNEKTQPPRYDIESRLPTPITPPPDEVQLGGIVQNPDWRPPPQPLHEKAPWLVYAILGLACVILLGIFALLAKEAIARADVAAPVTG